MNERRLPHRAGSLWTCVHGDPSKRTALLGVPGGPGCAHDYIASIATLAERGRPVVLYDHLGAGRSPAPPETEYSVDALRDDIEAVRAGLGLPRVHVFAHSAGSFAAIEYALAYPDRVASLVLSSPIVDVPAFQREAMRLVEKFGPQTSAAFVRAEHDPSRRDVAYTSVYYSYIAQHVCRFGDARLFTMLAGRGFNVKAHRTMKGGVLLYLVPPLDRWSAMPRLATIRVPVLITCGAHDVITPAIYEEAARALPRGEVCVLEHSSHAQHFEEPERFVEVVAAFLDRCDP